MNTYPNEARLKVLKVLVIDDEPYMRKVTKTILTAIGVTTVFEAEDGMVGYDLASKHHPAVIIVDWEMPIIDGPRFVQMVRTGTLVSQDTPIIMLSAHSEISRVIESARIGANEFVRKPVSIKTLRDRILTVSSNPRPTVKIGGYYGPAPRGLAPVDRYDPTPDGELSASVR